MSLQKSWIFIFIGLALIIFGFKYIPNIHYRLSATDLIDPNTESAKDLQDLKGKFSIKPNSLALIKKKDKTPFSNQDLCHIHESIVEIRNRFSSQIAHVFSPLEIRTPQKITGFFLYPKLIDACYMTKTSEPNLMAQLKQTPWENILSNNLSNEVLIQFAHQLLDPPGRYGQVDIIAFDKFKQALDDKLQMEISWSGELTYNSYFLQGIKRTQVLNLTALLLIFILLRLIHGTWRSGILFTLTILITNVFVHGSMGFWGHDINPLAAGIFFLITIAALEDYIFISSYLFDHPTKYWKSGFRKILLPGFFTSLTTAIGFISLCISDLESIRQFGIWTSIGAMLEWFATFFILPAFIQNFPWFSKWVDTKKISKFLISSKMTRPSPTKKITISLLTLIPISILISTKLNINSSPLEMFPKDHILQSITHTMKTEHGWISDISLEFPNYTNKEKVYEVIQKIKSHPIISKIENPLDTLDFLSKDFQDPLTKRMIERDYFSTKQGERLKNKNALRVILYISKIDNESILDLRSQVKQACQTRDNCFLTGELVAFADFSKQILKTLIESLAMSLILVGSIIVYLTRAQRKPVAISLIISSFWGPTILLGLIAITGVSVNMVSCVILSIVVGLTGDNAIQYLFASKQNDLEKGIKDVGIASIQCALIMSISTLILIASYFQPVRHLGELLSFALLLSLYGDLWLLKGLIQFKWLRK